MEAMLEEILKTVKATDMKLDALTSKVERLETRDQEKDAAINEISEENNILRIRLETMEQYSRRNNLVISGIPRCENENIRELVTKLASKWKIEIPANGIMAAHRLFAKAGTPDIIMKLVDRDLISRMIKNSKTTNLKSDCLDLQPTLNIYCSEHLTPYTKRILSYMKELRRSGTVKYVWTREGVVYTRRDDQSPAIRIPDEITLNQVLDQCSQMDPNGVEPDGTKATESDIPAAKTTEDAIPTPTKKRNIHERSPNIEIRKKHDFPSFKKPNINLRQRGYQTKLEKFRAPK